MVLVASPSKPFTYTAKGTPRRQAILNDYKTEIEALYATVDETAQPQVPLPANWSNSNALEFVRATVSNVMNQDVEDEDDFFQHGCDRYVCVASFAKLSLICLIASKQLGSGTLFYKQCVAPRSQTRGQSR